VASFRKIWFWVFFGLFFCDVVAQVPELTKKTNGVLCLAGYGKNVAVLAENTGVAKEHWQCVDYNSGLWLINQPGISDDVLLARLRRSRMVLASQVLHQISRRSNPNDPLIAKQNYLNTIKMPEVWNKGTGGLNTKGDTLVMAIIDDGMDTIHPDLYPNMWFNRNEIPWNGIDDDGNGYVDDYRGWNGGDQNNKTFTTQSLSAHGTGIAGVIAAKGNNALGIAGINWNLKILPVLCYTLNGVDSDLGVIRSMIYVLRMKQLYMATNGAKGAMIVALNTSVGIDRVFAADEPIWCALYDSLGNAGIMSSLATSNNNVDIGTAGDIPSLCPSNYTVVISNTTWDDTRIGSGFSTTHVDMAAPGQKVYTCDLATNGGANGPYREHSGTSFAAPQVGAAAALVQSLACDSFWSLHQRMPDSAARLVRSWVMKGTDALAVLTDKCATGGRLNTLKIWQQMSNWCNALQPGFSTKATRFNEALVWPNPIHTGDVLNIRSSEKLTDYVIYSPSGRVYQSGRITEQVKLGSNFSAGLYFVAFTAEDGSVFYAKFQVD